MPPTTHVAAGKAAAGLFSSLSSGSSSVAALASLELF
jgi:hypothetical protein